MRLVGAKDQGLLALVNQAKKDLYASFLAFLDFNDAVEVPLGIASTGFDIAGNDRVVSGPHVLVERRFKLANAKGRQEAVVDAVLQGISVNGVAEVPIGVNVLVSLGGC